MSHSISDFLHHVQQVERAAARTNHNSGTALINASLSSSSTHNHRQRQRDLYDFFPPYNSLENQSSSLLSPQQTIAATHAHAFNTRNAPLTPNPTNLFQSYTDSTGSLPQTTSVRSSMLNNTLSGNHHLNHFGSSPTPPTAIRFHPSSSTSPFTSVSELHRHQTNDNSRLSQQQEQELRMINSILNSQHSTHTNTNTNDIHLHFSPTSAGAATGTIGGSNNGTVTPFDLQVYQHLQQEFNRGNNSTGRTMTTTSPNNNHFHPQQHHQQHNRALALLTILSSRDNNNHTYNNINPSMAIGNGNNDADVMTTTMDTPIVRLDRNFHLTDPPSIDQQHQSHHQHHHSPTTPTAAAVAAATRARLNAVESFIDRASSVGYSGISNTNNHHGGGIGTTVGLGSGAVGVGGGYNETDSLWRHDDLHMDDDDVDSYDSSHLHPVVTTSAAAAVASSAMSPSSMAAWDRHRGHTGRIHRHDGHDKPPSSIVVPERTPSSSSTSSSRRTRSMSSMSRRHRNLPSAATRNPFGSNSGTSGHRGDSIAPATANSNITMSSDSLVLEDVPSSLVATTRCRTRSQLKRHRNATESSTKPSTKKVKKEQEKKTKSASKKASIKKDDSTPTTTAATTSSSKTEKDKKEEEDELNKCCICLDVPTSSDLAKIDGCSHFYCFGCIEEWAKRENTCPQCKERFTEIRRVNKIKQHKRKRGCSGLMNNVKKVKDRNQRSDYRHLNQLQTLFGTFSFF